MAPQGVGGATGGQSKDVRSSHSKKVLCIVARVSRCGSAESAPPGSNGSCCQRSAGPGRPLPHQLPQTNPQSALPPAAALCQPCHPHRACSRMGSTHRCTSKLQQAGRVCQQAGKCTRIQRSSTKCLVHRVVHRTCACAPEFCAAASRSLGHLFQEPAKGRHAMFASV